MKMQRYQSPMKTVLLATMAATALSLGSCADHYDGDETWSSSVRNTTLTSPEEITIEEDKANDRITVSWPVVRGAGGYEVLVLNVNIPEAPDTVKYEQALDGCSLTFDREEETNYQISVRALGNGALNNQAAAEYSVKQFSTFEAAFGTIPVGDIADYFVQNPIPADSVGKDIIFDLEPGGQYTVSDAVDFGYYKVTLRSTSKTNHATVTATGNKAAFIVQHGFTLKYLNLDWTESTSKGIILLSETPNDSIEGGVPLNETIWTNADTKGSYVIQEPVTVRGCMIRNMKKALISVGQNNGWVVVNMNVIDNIIQMANSDSYLLDFYGGGKSSAFKNLTMQNNTIYNLEANTTQFAIRFGNASNAIKLFGKNSGAENGRFVWNISNNTILRTMTGKGFGNNIPNNPCVNNIMRNNIFVDVFQLQKYIQGNQERDYANNVIWGVDINIDSTDKTTYCEEADPGFTVPTEPLDFTLPNGGIDLTPSGRAIELRSGDSRWLPAGADEPVPADEEEEPAAE